MCIWQAAFYQHSVSAALMLVSNWTEAQVGSSLVALRELLQLWFLVWLSQLPNFSKYYGVLWALVNTEQKSVK